MIEQAIEAKLITALEAVVTDCDIVGFWQTETGNTRKESPLISVVCNPRNVETESLPLLSCQIEVKILSNIETDQKKAKIIEWTTVILDYLYTLNANETARTALSDTGYSVTGFKLDGGTSGIDTDSKVFYSIIPATISCSV